MTYDYFYGQQAEMFAFYRVPKVLFTEDCFWNVSTDAKLLYGILLDRMNLSARNGWLDEEGRVYIIFTIEEIKGALLTLVSDIIHFKSVIPTVSVLFHNESLLMMNIEKSRKAPLTHYGS